MGAQIRSWAAVGLLMVSATGLARAPAPRRPALALSTPVAMGFIGDSITALYGVPEATAALLSRGRPGQPVVAVNRGVSGTDSADWLPSGALLAPAEQALRAAGVRVVHVMLGTNDSRGGVHLGPARAPAAYGRNLRAIAAHLVSGGFTVVLSAPPYTVPGSYPGRSRASDALLRAYAPQLRALTHLGRVHVGATAAYAYFATHPAQLWDGVHPAPAGGHVLARLWATALAPLVRLT